MGYPNLFATQTAVLGASFLKSESESYNPNGVASADADADKNADAVEPDQYVFTDIIKIYSFTTINIEIKKEEIFLPPLLILLL
jgi:hypothetical protein